MIFDLKLSQSNFSTYHTKFVFLQVEDIYDEIILKTLVNKYGKELRVIIPFFRDGIIAISGKNTLFETWKPEMQLALRKKLSYLSKIGIPVIGYFDVLQWSSTPKGRRQLEDRVPGVIERLADGSTGFNKDIFYASPFSPITWAIITDMMRDNLANSLFEGIILSISLPVGNFYGFSDISRIALIKSGNVDPIDIKMSRESERPILLSAVYNTRLNLIRKNVESLISNIKTNVYVSGYIDNDTFNLQVRSRSLNDWLSWSDIDSINGLFLTSSMPLTADLLKATNELFQKLKIPKKEIFVDFTGMETGKLLEEVTRETERLNWPAVYSLKMLRS